MRPLPLLFTRCVSPSGLFHFRPALLLGTYCFRRPCLTPVSTLLIRALRRFALIESVFFFFVPFILLHPRPPRRIDSPPSPPPKLRPQIIYSLPKLHEPGRPTLLPIRDGLFSFRLLGIPRPRGPNIRKLYVGPLQALTMAESSTDGCPFSPAKHKASAVGFPL